MSWCGVTDEWVEERGRGKHYCNTDWMVRDPCTPTHSHVRAHTHLNLGACKHTSSRSHADAHYTQTVFEGRCNHGDTHLRAVVAAWRWLRLSLNARRDEQSEHWHTSRRHVNSNQRYLSVKARRSRQTDATATLPSSCRLSQMNGQSWPHRYSFGQLVYSWCEHMLRWCSGKFRRKTLIHIKKAHLNLQYVSM